MLLFLIVARRRMFYVIVQNEMDGKLLNPDDHAIAGATVTLEDGRMAVTDAEGQFSFGAPANVYQMTVEKKNRKSRPFPVKVAPGQTYRTEADWMKRK